jgi:hypothetical protein
VLIRATVKGGARLADYETIRTAAQALRLQIPRSGVRNDAQAAAAVQAQDPSL